MDACFSDSAPPSRPPARTLASTGPTRTTTRHCPSPGRAPPTGRSVSPRPEAARTARRSPPAAPGAPGQRLPPAEAGDVEAAVNDVAPHDDALASAWYRTKVLPVLARRVLDELKE